jgi:Caspase domain
MVTTVPQGRAEKLATAALMDQLVLSLSCHCQILYSTHFKSAQMRHLTKQLSYLWAFVYLTTIAVSCQNAPSQPDTDKYLRTQPVKRLAIIICNQDYDHGDTVSTAYSDCVEVAKKLQQAGFSLIRFVPGAATNGELVSWIKDLANAAGPSNEPVIIFFYYAGHGYQPDDWPSLIPTSTVPDPDQKYMGSLSLATIMTILGNHTNGLAIFILDSCRDIGTVPKQQANHLAAIPAGDIAVVNLSTDYGSPALDHIISDPNHSEFAYFLIAHLLGQESLSEVFEEVKRKVKEQTKSQQVPVALEGGASINHFFLSPPPSELLVEKQEWESTLNDGNDACVREFTDKYPGSEYLISAVQWLGDHEGSNGTCPK